MRNLRDELDRRPLWGAFISSNSALAAEFMAQAGFDWLVIDARIAAACRYPSAGYRSFGPWRDKLQIPGYTTDDADRRVVCLVQIETRAAIDNLDAIVAVPGIDGAYIGPADLSLSHGGGLSWRADNTVLHELSERVLKSCHRAGKLAIAHTADPGDALHWGGLGFDMVTATSDTRLISRSAASAVEKLRAGNGRAG